MAVSRFLTFFLFAGVSTGSYIRYSRDIPSGSFSGSSSGSGSFSGSSSSSYSSSSGTKVNPGPGGYGNFNAFSGMSNFGNPPFGGGGGGGGQSSFSAAGTGQPQFGFPGFGQGFNPFIPQYGQQYPYTPFPPFPAPFDFTAFLNQYFQALHNFQSQVAANGFAPSLNSFGQSLWGLGNTRSQFPILSSAANQGQGSPNFPQGGGGFSPIDNNEVGGNAFATYSPQGGYGSASVFPAPEGGLESRFGEGDSGSQGSGGPVSSVGGNFKPPQGSSYGVFTSSSSGSSDINGKKTSFKQSSIGINDNGKVTTYTAHDP